MGKFWDFTRASAPWSFISRAAPIFGTPRRLALLQNDLIFELPE
jgi:hypothetical protein